MHIMHVWQVPLLFIAVAVAAATSSGNILPSLRSSSTSVATDDDPRPDPSSACDYIHPENLPQECSCRQGNGPHSLVVECLKTFNGTFFSDTIGLKLVVEPCDELGSSVSLDVTDANYNIDYPIERIVAGEQKIFPIPGLSFMVPELGHVGVDVVVYIAGNPDQLLLQVGLDACVAVRSKFVCAESLPYLDTTFPWWVMNGTYHFGDLCAGTTTTTRKRSEAMPLRIS